MMAVCAYRIVHIKLYLKTPVFQWVDSDISCHSAVWRNVHSEGRAGDVRIIEFDVDVVHSCKRQCMLQSAQYQWNLHLPSLCRLLLLHINLIANYMTITIFFSGNFAQMAFDRKWMENLLKLYFKNAHTCHFDFVGDPKEAMGSFLELDECIRGSLHRNAQFPGTSLTCVDVKHIWNRGQAKL